MACRTPKYERCVLIFRVRRDPERAVVRDWVSLWVRNDPDFWAACRGRCVVLGRTGPSPSVPVPCPSRVIAVIAWQVPRVADEAVQVRPLLAGGHTADDAVSAEGSLDLIRGPGAFLQPGVVEHERQGLWGAHVLHPLLVRCGFFSRFRLTVVEVVVIHGTPPQR